MGFGVRVWMVGWRGARAVKKVADSPVKGHDGRLGIRCEQSMLVSTHILIVDHVFAFV